MKKSSKIRKLVEDAVEQEDAVGELRKQIGKLERQLHKAKLEQSNLIEAVIEQLSNNPPRLVAPLAPKLGKVAAKEVAVLHLSDIQLGKVTETYDTAKAEERVMLACQKAVLITDIRRKSTSIPEIHVYLGGDMIEGENIFSTQAHEIDSSVYDQACVNGPGIFARAILYLLGKFDQVIVYTVPGNHGRNGPKNTNAHPRTNWDQVLYHTTKVLLLGTESNPRKELDGRLIFNLSERFWIVDPVFGWGNLLVHGHQISGGFAGFPWYGTAKKAWGWIDSLPEKWDNLFFGHFHTPTSMTLGPVRRAYANGTTESDNTFAQEQLAAAGRPCQRLVFMNAEHGVVSDCLLYL